MSTRIDQLPVVELQYDAVKCALGIAYGFQFEYLTTFDHGVESCSSSVRFDMQFEAKASIRFSGSVLKEPYEFQ
jgi:hypothetical protein